MPNTTATIRTSVSGSTAPFQKPAGIIAFGKSIFGKFTNAFIFKYFLQNQPMNIGVVDYFNLYFYQTYACNYDCYDDICTNTYYCYSSYELCNFDIYLNCLDCLPPGSGRNKTTNCQKCLSGNSFIDHKCNLYLGCANTHNCVSCSKNSTTCDSCHSGSFLYDQNATSTMCIGNFYIACENSCENCNPGPDCYDCASVVLEDKNSCKVDSIGYQLSFEAPNIIIDFAHPLTVGLTKNSFKATSSTSDDIATNEWTLTGCGAGSKKCLIGASNINESQFPIDLNINFEQV